MLLSAHLEGFLEDLVVEALDAWSAPARGWNACLWCSEPFMLKSTCGRLSHLRTGTLGRRVSSECFTKSLACGPQGLLCKQHGPLQDGMR